MGKFIIEMDYHEDRQEIDMLMNCKDAYTALWDINALVRHKMKTEELTEEQEKFYEQICEITVTPLEYYY